MIGINEFEPELKESTRRVSAVERLVRLCRCKVVSVLCGMVVCFFTWVILGKSMEVWGSIEEPAWWMFYGVVVYEICKWMADMTQAIVYKPKD